MNFSFFAVIYVYFLNNVFIFKHTSILNTALFYTAYMHKYTFLA